jgi:hypothetical protein
MTKPNYHPIEDTRRGSDRMVIRFTSM